MNFLLGLYQSSVGKKILMGTTGVCLCIYLIVHLCGNLLLFKNDGGAAFNAYAEILPSLLFIRVIEILLFAIFLGHMILGTILWLKNRSARPRRYAVNAAGENSPLVSRIMFITGAVVACFLIIHLRQFWAPARFGADKVEMYALVKAALGDPVYGSVYIAGMVLLALHLRHGFQSAVQTFGLRNSAYLPLINLIGLLFWVLIPLGFAAMPVYFLLKF
ncbi:MAG TPA: succinate dehydrogenase cytochrome b subunit [Bacteroidota bacterium]|nr:succinate dehydrogenase cytochrome b subunit [Bacteroidota bacterium]